MEKSRLYNKIMYSVIALALFVVGLSVCVCLCNNRERKSYQMVVFGDSVLGLVRDESGVVAQLSELMGMSAFNAAFGGTCAARVDTENRLDYGKDALSMVGLAKAIEMDDFGPQQTVFLKEALTERFAEVIDGLEKIDFRSAEIVLIEQGLNDFYAGVPLDNPDNPLDEYTYLGAMRRSIKALRRGNPQVRIIIVTSTYSWLIDSGVTCEEYDAGYGNQADYVNGELVMAEEMGVEIIDLFHDFYPHDVWDDYRLYTNDGLHPNAEGREMIARRIADFLEGGVE